VNATGLSGMNLTRWLLPPLLAALLFAWAAPAARAQDEGPLSRPPADTQYTPRVAVESTSAGPGPAEPPAWSEGSGGASVGLLPTTGGPLLLPAAAALAAGAGIAVAVRRMRR